MIEDKMREEHWRQLGIAGMPRDKIRLAEETWKAATEACAAIKDAEIAARDLMIKKRDEALHNINCNWDEMHPEDIERVITEAIANSEHHNSRALEKKLLEAEINILYEFWAIIDGYYASSWRDMIEERKAKLAELNKE